MSSEGATGGSVVAEGQRDGGGARVDEKETKRDEQGVELIVSVPAKTREAEGSTAIGHVRKKRGAQLHGSPSSILVYSSPR